MTLTALILASIPWKKIGSWLIKANAWLILMLKPLGGFGLLMIALIDSSLIPLPIDAAVVDYVVHDHTKFLYYCFMAALGAALGGLLRYCIGRAGGELFLLKRINRQRYEQLRDRFEKQEFLAVMVPAMLPPPFPFIIFELAAGVFEMKPLWFFLAVFSGKLIRGIVVSILLLTFGPAILRTISGALHNHLRLVFGIVGILGLLLLFWIVRKLFERDNREKLPIEEIV